MIPLIQPLPPDVLDILLSRGFYRMQQHVFTTSSISVDNQVVPVFWARIRLEGFSLPRRYRALVRRCSRFTLTLHEGAITPELEDLYAAYRDRMDFDAPPTIASFLIDERRVNFFPTRMWLVHDAGRLIAAGYFDEGADSAAGILNCYHPDYRAYSPGLWLYLESVRHAAAQGKQFFYPGYIALGYGKFDYKLKAGKERVELWDEAGARWIPYADTIHAQATMLGEELT